MEGVEKEWEQFRDIVNQCGMWERREVRVVNSGVKKLVWLWPKREELLRNDCREEMGIHMRGIGPNWQ